jgi:hypothetical protein
MKSEDVLALTLEKLRWLKLPGMVQYLPALLEEAANPEPARRFSPALWPTRPVWTTVASSS